MADITLCFSSYHTPALDHVVFTHSLLDEPRQSYRGKGLFPTLGQHTFQWTPAVKALAVLLLRTRARDLSGSVWPVKAIPALSGGSGSLAASLDYALTKKPLWLLDMFGVRSDGDVIARSLFVRWNSERKRGGYVFVATNSVELAAESINITLDGRVLDFEECASLASAIECDWIPAVTCTRVSRAASVREQ